MITVGTQIVSGAPSGGGASAPAGTGVVTTSSGAFVTPVASAATTRTTLGLGSLAGIPPLVGFMGKLFIFIAAFQAGLYGLLAIAVIGVVVSIYYYFGWIKAAFFETWGKSADAPAHPTRTPVDFVTGFALSALALAVVVLGFYQGPLGAWLSPR